jgi:hypothetical protein
MAATATARSSAAARRVSAPRHAPRKPAPRRASASTAKRRRGNTPITGFVPVAAAAGAVGGIADSGLFVWLTRGRLWIGLLGALLVGIVGLNVVALSFSASSSNAGQAADSLRRANSALRAEIAGKLSNSEIQQVAAKLGLVMPGAGDVGYVSTSPHDAKTAAQRLRDGELTIAAPVATTTPVATVPADPAATTIDPVTTTDPAATTPVEPVTDPAVVPAETTAPPATETTATGSVGAP